MKDFGIYRYLTSHPVWETSAILLSILAVIPLGRSVLDGFLYNLSFTSNLGDQVGLVMATSIVITVMQREPVVNVPQKLQKILQNSRAHWVFAFVSFLVGVTVHFLLVMSRTISLMDTYHDLFILPLFFYFGITLIPIMIYNGSKKEKLFFWGFIGLWLMLCLVDINDNLMYQHMWFYSHIHRWKSINYIDWSNWRL